MKIGDKLLCIEPIENIEKGKCYIIEDEYHNLFLINGIVFKKFGDKNKKYVLSTRNVSDHFIEINESRRIKLEKISENINSNEH